MGNENSAFFLSWCRNTGLRVLITLLQINTCTHSSAFFCHSKCLYLQTFVVICLSRGPGWAESFFVLFFFLLMIYVCQRIKMCRERFLQLTGLYKLPEAFKSLKLQRKDRLKGSKMHHEGPQHWIIKGDGTDMFVYLWEKRS